MIYGAFLKIYFKHTNCDFLRVIHTDLVGFLFIIKKTLIPFFEHFNMYEIIPGRLAHISFSVTHGGMCINNFHMADIALYRTHIGMVVGAPSRPSQSSGAK